MLKGARPGYEWALPEVLYCSQSLHAVLHDFYKNEAPSMPFLLPALALSSDDLWEITEHTALMVNCPMSPARFSGFPHFGRR